MENVVNVANRKSNTGAPAEGAVPRIDVSGRLLLLIGAGSGMLGGLLALVANGLHPHPTDFHLETLLHEIAQSSIWGGVHLTLIFALVLVLVSLVALALSMDGEPGATLARIACVVTLLGGALILVSTAIDGFAMNQLARAWSNAPLAEKAAALRTAAAFEVAQYAIFSLSIVLFLGIGIFLYGLATVLGSAYPKALGWLAMLSGVGEFVVGIAQVLGGPELRSTELFSVLFSVLITIWILIMSLLMWRKARTTNIPLVSR
jgi:hypothetical protein